MKPKLDYYKILNTPRDAEYFDIKKAFHIEILKWHPDRNSSPEAKEKTMLIIEAWDILSDPEKKKLYDLTLSDTSKPSSANVDKVHKWQEQAQQKASKTASQPITVILKETGLGIAQWLTGCIVVLVYMAFMVGAASWITNKSAGMHTQYAGYVYLGSFLLFLLCSILLFSFLKKQIFFLKCDYCNKKVDNYHVCQGCGESGCFVCIGVLKRIFDSGFTNLLYECKKCGSSLKYVEPKYGKFKYWLS